jgi:predicted nuclease of predicted toxin-antitoxin system
MKLLFDESLSPRLIDLLKDLFPESESALKNGLARAGDRKILEHAVSQNFILVSTDSDFERLLVKSPGAKVIILRACDYPTKLAAEILRRNAIRIVEFSTGPSQLLLLEP